MLVKKLFREELKEVAALEREVYPEGFRLGYNDFLDDYNYHPYIRNYGTYIKGKLVAYIISYGNHYRDRYISDFVCTNPKALLPLLFAYADENTRKEIKAEFRKNSYDLFNKIREEYPNAITVYREEKRENYYADEDGYFVSFEFNDLTPKNINHAILKEIYTKSYMVTIDRVLSSLHYNYSLEEISKHKTKILRHIHNRNLEFLNQMGNSFQLTVFYGINVKRGTENKAINKLKKLGYLNRDDNPDQSSFRTNDDSDLRKIHGYYEFTNFKNTVSWYRTQTLDNQTYNNNTLSYYRSKIKRDVINYFKKSDAVSHILLLDKDGRELLYVHPRSSTPFSLVPAVYQTTFDIYINRLTFQNKIKEITKNVASFSNHNGELDYYNIMFLIRRYVSEETALSFLTRVTNIVKQKIKVDKNKSSSEENDYNVGLYEEETLPFGENNNLLYHDYFFVANELMNMRNLLTKGAYKVIFNKSFNQMNKINNLLKSFYLLDPNFLKGYLKDLRSNISKLIRLDKIEELKTYTQNIIKELDYAYLDSKKISEKHYEEAFEFLKRVQKYAPHVSMFNLFSVFKGKTLSMIQNKYDGLFKEMYLELDKKELGNLIHLALGSKGKNSIIPNPQRLYTVLNKLGDISSFIQGNINNQQAKIILQELKQRNVTISKYIELLPRFHAKIEQKCSPEFLVAGDASVCCMSFGQKNAKQYALEKGFGVFNVYYNNRIIANSVLWINEAYNSLIIDNIEVHPNYVDKKIHIAQLYKQMISTVLKDYKLDFALQGSSYNDLSLASNHRKISLLRKPKDVKNLDFYSDANSVAPIEINLTADEIFKRINQIENSLLKVTNQLV